MNLIDSEDQLMREIETIRFEHSFIQRPTVGNSLSDQQTALIFNSRYLEYIQVKINQIRNESSESILCIQYPNQSVHFDKIQWP